MYHMIQYIRTWSWKSVFWRWTVLKYNRASKDPITYIIYPNKTPIFQIEFLLRAFPIGKKSVFQTCIFWFEIHFQACLISFSASKSRLLIWNRPNISCFVWRDHKYWTTRWILFSKNRKRKSSFYHNFFAQITQCRFTTKE